jgi:SAM-dependent methyltransferase
VTPTTAADPRSFDHLPAVFDRFAELVGGPLNDYLTARLPESGHRAVDLGCGTGQHAWLLSRVFNEVLAVDVSLPMLQFAQRHRSAANISYQHRDLLDVTPGRDGRFDLVLSTHTLHHVPDLRFGLEQIRSLVRPGGRVVLIDNVDPRRQVPRRWFRTEARKALLLDLRHHRRPIRDAVELYRLSTHPGWLDHLTTDVFLTREEFTQVYGMVFPGADFTPMYRTLAMHWRERGRA